jgi:hypothetical protein
MIAQLTLSHGLSIKILRSVGIDVENIPALLAFIASSKHDTGEYSKMIAQLPKEKQSTMPPPYALVWLALTAWAKVQATFDPNKWPKLLPALVEYENAIKANCEDDPIQQMWNVTETVRYCRVKTTYDPQRRLLEVGTGLEGGAAEILALIREGPLRAAGAVKKKGIAPKSGLERRVERVLRRLRVWGRDGERI